MLKDTIRPNGKTKRVQYVKAFRGGTSSMGSPYKKGDPILHLSSSRCTGETFVILPSEIIKTLFRHPPLIIDTGPLKRPGRWASPKKWSEQLHEKWEKDYITLHGHGRRERCEHPPAFYRPAFYRTFEEKTAAKIWRKTYKAEIAKHGNRMLAEDAANKCVAEVAWKNEDIKGR